MQVEVDGLGLDHVMDIYNRRHCQGWRLATVHNHPGPSLELNYTIPKVNTSNARRTIE